MWPEDVRAVLRRGRRVPHGLPLPDDAAALHVDRDGGPPPAGGDHGADAGHPAELPVGDLPAQPRRAHARDGHRPRARLHVPHLRRRPAHARERRHPPAPRAADGERPATDRAHHLPADDDAGHADPLLRRRDRHGRQHLPRRPQRRAHADAVDTDRNAGFSRADPQRLYLPPIMDPIYGYQAVNVEAQSREPVVAAQLDAAPDRHAPALPAFGRGRSPS